MLSRSAVSQATERLWQEYESFANRDLSEFQVAYFFVGGVAERLHAGMPREAVLCAWGITEDGRKVLLHLAPGTKEDTASCKAFFEDLKRRGLPDPLLAVTDGAPGLVRAVETCFPRALRQRCLVHRLRNLRSKAPDSQWLEIAIRARACYEAASPTLAMLLRDDFVPGLRAGVAGAREVFPRGLRGLHRPSPVPAAPSEGHPDDEPPGATLPRGAAPDEDHPARLRRAAGAEADVRGGDPGCRPLARDHGRRVRAAVAARDSRGAQSRSRPADGAGRGDQADGPGPKTASWPVKAMEGVAAFGSRSTISGWAVAGSDYPAALGLDRLG